MNDLDEDGTGQPDAFARRVMPLADSWFPALLLLCAFLTIPGNPTGAWLRAAGGYLATAPPPPTRLKSSTLDAFEHYVWLTEARNRAELEQGTHLLWVDSLPEPQRFETYAALKRGQARIRRLDTLDNGQKILCPGGLIHHWVGAAFITDAKLDGVLGVLQDYDHHSKYYAPDVERSKIESHEDGHFVVFLRFRRHKVITVVLDTEHDVRYFRDSATRAHSRSSATRITQVENAGKPSEREKAPGEDDGFLWRMETWWRMEERDGGVYVQSEVVSLTRDIPTGLAWLIGPFVTSIPKESQTFTLEATRKAVQAQVGTPAS